MSQAAQRPVEAAERPDHVVRTNQNAAKRVLIELSETSCE